MARSIRIASIAFVCLLALTGAARGGATITIVNKDPASTGFNDPTPATPVGGNNGTTIGQQRLNAFQHAANIWGGLLDSSVEIRIEASFAALDCTATTAVLGAASPTQAVSDFPGAQFPGTWYPSALANRIAGSDLFPSVSDITARFNLNLGHTGCFDGSGWYYGFDNNHGDLIDMVSVLLHEFAHGLGFLTFVDDSGNEFMSQPDVFERNIFDATANKHWTDMTAAERGTSTVNTGNVLWDGPTVTAMAPQFLDGTPSLSITAPASIAGFVRVGTASFGPELSETAVTGPIVAAVDPVEATGTSTDGCSPLTNASAVAGKLALVDRGNCNFTVKADNVQAAGAIGLIVANNAAGDPPGMGGDDATIHIPAVSVTQADGAAIRAALGSQVIGSLLVNGRMLAGTGAGRRMKLYAPNPVESGSSISHWDTSAFPDLLMEPNLTGALPHTVDLTLPALYDIGWRPDVTPTPAARDAVQPTGGNDQTHVVAPRP